MCKKQMMKILQVFLKETLKGFVFFPRTDSSVRYDV